MKQYELTLNFFKLTDGLGIDREIANHLLPLNVMISGMDGYRKKRVKI